MTKRNNLTIAIPTFNRKELLLENLRSLVSGTRCCDILVIDNDSLNLNEDELRKKIPELNFRDFTFIKNPVNIGGNANILKCIENCRTEYIVILGDDDFISDDFETTVMRELEHKFDWLLFYADDMFQPKRHYSNHYLSLTDFLNGLSSINEVVFCSVNIYRTRYLFDGLEAGHHYQNTMAPHFVSMVKGIEKNEDISLSFLVSSSKILKSVSNNKDISTSWSLHKAFTGIYSLCNIDVTAESRKQIIRLIKGSRKNWLHDKALLYSYAMHSLKVGKRKALNENWSLIFNSLRVDILDGLYMSILFVLAILFNRQLICLNEIKKRYYSGKKVK